MRFSPASPVSVSPCAEPVRFSIPVSESPPASPLLALLCAAPSAMLRSTVTPTSDPAYDAVSLPAPPAIESPPAPPVRLSSSAPPSR